VQIGDNRAAEWVRRSNPVALGLLFSGLAGQVISGAENYLDHFSWYAFQMFCANGVYFLNHGLQYKYVARSDKQSQLDKYVLLSAIWFINAVPRFRVLPLSRSVANFIPYLTVDHCRC
jgi:hypothetical protein